MKNPICALTLAAGLLMTGCFGTHDTDNGRCGAQDAEGEGACRALLGYKFDGTQCVSFGGCECVGADCDAVFNTLDACLQACADDDPAPGPDTCAPQDLDIRVAGHCTEELWVTFDGTRCTAERGCCEGSNCEAGFHSIAECEARYEVCMPLPTDPGPCAAQDITGVGDCRAVAGYAFDGRSCALVGCACEGADCGQIFDSPEACEARYAACLSPEAEPTTCAPEVEGPVPAAPTCRPGTDRWYFTEDGCVEGCACTEGAEYYGWPAVCPPSYDDAAACEAAHPGCTPTTDPTPVPGARVNCDRGDIGCRASEPVCPAGEVASVDGSCWGPCVPVAECAPVECTDETTYRCPGEVACDDGFCSL